MRSMANPDATLLWRFESFKSNCWPIVLTSVDFRSALSANSHATALRRWPELARKSESKRSFSMFFSNFAEKHRETLRCRPSGSVRWQSDRLMWSSSVERFAKQLTGWLPGPQPGIKVRTLSTDFTMTLPWHYHDIGHILLAQFTAPVRFLSPDLMPYLSSHFWIILISFTSSKPFDAIEAADLLSGTIP